MRKSLLRTDITVLHLCLHSVSSSKKGRQNQPTNSIVLTCINYERPHGVNYLFIQFQIMLHTRYNNWFPCLFSQNIKTPEINVSIWGQTSDLISPGDRILWTGFLATCIRRSPCIKRSLSHSPSLHSKRFRLVSEQRKTEERYSRFWPREKWNKSQKFFPTPSQLFYWRHFSSGS